MSELFPLIPGSGAISTLSQSPSDESVAEGVKGQFLTTPPAPNLRHQSLSHREGIDSDYARAAALGENVVSVVSGDADEPSSFPFPLA